MYERKTKSVMRPEVAAEAETLLAEIENARKAGNSLSRDEFEAKMHRVWDCMFKEPRMLVPMGKPDCFGNMVDEEFCVDDKDCPYARECKNGGR